MNPTTTPDVTESVRSSPPAHRSARFTSVAEIVWWGTFGWIGWLWLIVALGYAVTLASATIWGHPEQSLWEPIAASWWRWPIGGAGVSMAVAFVPMLVSHGVTRHRASQGIGAVGVAISAIAAVILTIGFVVERAVYEANDLAWISDSGTPLADTPILLLLVGFTTIHLSCFVSGWTVGVLWARYGWRGLLAIPLACIPLFVTDVLVAPAPFGGNHWILSGDDAPTLWIGLPVSIVVIAAGATVAQRLGRFIALR